MKFTRVLVSDAAGADIMEQADWYESQSDRSLADRWQKSVTSTVLRILQRPRSGALCRFRPKELNDIRRVSIPGFRKHLLFYKIENDKVLIVRVLHGARDIESLFE